MSKDFGLILAAAAQLDVSMPATERAAAVSSAEAAIGSEEDFSAVIRRLELQVA
jgi:3-hydroxyisobutyrate dehydrogenase-like beta-hydroxyacid dehydrogenase